MRVARERKKGTSSANVRANTSEHSEGDTENFANGRSVTPTRPDPTRPDPTTKTSAPAAADDGMDRFDEFWDTYAKKVDRKTAEAKWRLALKRKGVTPDLLIQAARTYVANERLSNEGGRFIMDPARWLNGQRWEDERPTNVHAAPRGRPGATRSFRRPLSLAVGELMSTLSSRSDTSTAKTSVSASARRGKPTN